MAYFDDLLEQVEEADREIFKKYGKIAEKVNKDADFLNKWEDWRKKEYDESTGLTKGAKDLLAQKDQQIRDKETEIEALKLLQENDVTWEEMQGNVDKMLEQKIKSLNLPDASKLTPPPTPSIKVKNPDGTEKEIPVTDYVRNLERGMELTYTKSSHLPLKYYKEFNDISDAPEFTQEALWKHMQENSIADFEKGYESFVAPLRARKAEAAAKVRDEEIRKDERRKVEQEYMQRNGGRMPDDTQGVAPEMSALSRKIADRKKVEVQGPKLTPGTVGDMTGANDAYQQWLKDQASGTKPNFPTGMIQ